MQRLMEKDFIPVIIMTEKSLVIENLKVKRNFWKEMIYSLGKRNGKGERRNGEDKKKKRNRHREQGRGGIAQGNN